MRTFFDGILNFLTPLPTPPVKTNIQPFFETKMILARNIESGEHVWLEAPVTHVDLRTRKTSHTDGYPFRTDAYD